MKVTIAIGDDVIELGEVQSSNLPAFLSLVEHSPFEDGTGEIYLYDGHEFQITPITEKVNLHIFTFIRK